MQHRDGWAQDRTEVVIRAAGGARDRGAEHGLCDYCLIVELTVMEVS